MEVQKDLTKQLLHKNVINSKEGFGNNKNYKKGDIVVWCGRNPCIGKIKSKAKGDINIDCWVINENHNSLHYSHLRYATPDEIAQLGRKRIVLLS